MPGMGLTVIVPVFGRQSNPAAVLESLARQTVASSFEVRLVGSVQPAFVRAWQDRFPALVPHGAHSTARAAALNAAAEAAGSDVLVFLGENVIAEPKLLAAHIAHHATGHARLVLGDVTLPRTTSDDLQQTVARLRREDTLHRRSVPGRRSTYRDFRSGNVSLRREDFLRARGFDPVFEAAGRADHDLGYRLLRGGGRFVVDREACATERTPVTLDTALLKERAAGRDDVRLGMKHPELRRGLRLLLTAAPRSRWPVRVAFGSSDVGDVLAWLGKLVLPLYQRGKLRLRWLRTFRLLGEYAYWRGVHDVLGSWTAFDEFRREARALPRCEMDVTEGLPENLPEIWVHGPSILAVTARGRHMGDVRISGPIDELLRDYVTRAIIHQLGSRLQLELDTLRETAAAPRAATADGSEQLT